MKKERKISQEMILYRELYLRLLGRMKKKALTILSLLRFFVNITHFHFHEAIGYGVNRLIASSFILVLLA